MRPRSVYLAVGVSRRTQSKATSMPIWLQSTGKSFRHHGGGHPSSACTSDPDLAISLNHTSPLAMIPDEIISQETESTADGSTWRLERTTTQKRIRLGPLRPTSTIYDLLPEHLPSVDAASYTPSILPTPVPTVFSPHSSSSSCHKP